MGRGDDAEKFLRAICETRDGDRHLWSIVRAVNLIWTLGRLSDASAILAELAAGESDHEKVAGQAVEACVGIGVSFADWVSVVRLWLGPTAAAR